MKTKEEIINDIESIVVSFEQLKKVPANFRQSRVLEDEIKKALESLRVDLSGLAIATDNEFLEGIEGDVARMDSKLADIQTKTKDLETPLRELYEKIKAKKQEAVSG